MDTTRPPITRRLVSAVAAAVLVMTAIVTSTVEADAGPRAAARDTATRADLRATTQAYVQEFWPLWLSYEQTQVDPSNRLLGPRRITPAYRSIVAINNDTLYASSPIDFRDLDDKVVILTMPAASSELSYSVLSLDGFGNVYDTDVPGKSSGAGPTQETVYALVPPGSQASIPAGAVRVEMPLDFSLLIFRIDRYSDGVDLTPEGTTFRENLKLVPVSGYDPIDDPDAGATRIVPAATFGVPFKTIADGLVQRTPIRYLRQLQVAVQSSKTPPLTVRQQAISDAFDEAFGPNGSGIRPWSRRAFARGARSAHDAIIDNYLGNTIGGSNWIHFTNIGAWGPDESLDRSSIAEFIQYSNGISTAAYYHAFEDDRGKSLRVRAKRGYVITFPAGTPKAERFWSLTAYTPNSIELIDNPLDKYLVASYTPGLEENQDGSISIHVARTRPDGVAEANWLPVSDEPFNVMLRIYGVEDDVSSYVPPPIRHQRGRR